MTLADPNSPGRRDFTMVMRLFSGLILICSSGAACSGSSKNLLSNQNFDQNTPAFLTGYLKSDDLNNPGNYAIGSDPSQFNSNWPSDIQPHSGDSMMIVNGADQPDTIVWDSGPIRVRPHTAYFFGAYATSLFATSPPVLVFRINGAEVGKDFLASQPVGQWKQVNTVWNSGTSTKISISIVDENTEAYGNDFALDDLTLADSPVFTVAPHVIAMSFPSFAPRPATSTPPAPGVVPVPSLISQ